MAKSTVGEFSRTRASLGALLDECVDECVGERGPEGPVALAVVFGGYLVDAFDALAHAQGGTAEEVATAWFGET